MTYDEKSHFAINSWDHSMFQRDLLEDVNVASACQYWLCLPVLE